MSHGGHGEKHREGCCGTTLQTLHIDLRVGSIDKPYPVPSIPYRSLKEDCFGLDLTQRR